MGTATKQQNKVPKLRFSEFDGEWENKKLGEVCSFTQGVQIPQNEQIKEEKDGFIRYLYIRDFFTDKYSCFVKNKYPNKIIKSNEIMVVNTGNTAGEIFMGATGVLSNNCFKVGFDSEKINHRFLYLYLKSRRTQDMIKGFFNSGGQPHLGHKNIALVSFTSPSFSEQQKIADFLGSVDDWLDNLRSQKTALQTYKQGMMQKLFSQQIRFKDESGKNFPKWEDKELGDMLGYKQPTEFIVESTEYSDEYKTPVLTAGKTFILGYTDETKGIFDYELPVIIFDDFTTATQFVDFEFKVKSSAMKILVPLDGNNVKFLYEAMQLIRFEIGGHGRHWISKYSKLTVATPSLEEQNRIADFVIALDESIEAKVEEVAKVEQWKKGLMQKMFV